MSIRRFYLIGFAVLMAFDTLTQVSLKLATANAGGFSPTLAWVSTVVLEGWFFAALIGYLGAFVTWMTLLKHAPMGPAFAASHLEVVAVLIISVVYFGERLTLLQSTGALMIVLGIVCLAMSEGEAPASQER